MRIVLRAASEPIRGYLNVSTGVKLSTVNAGIDVTIDLYASDPGRPHEVVLETVKGKHVCPPRWTIFPSDIAANVSLFDVSSSQDSAFAVRANTLTAPVNLTLFRSPAGGDVQLSATSVDGATALRVDAAFEGNLTASSLSNVTSLGRLDVADPTGNEWTRTMTISEIGNHSIRGMVSWGGHVA
ncbi:hypothetical protein K488DRAFT_48056 [Vararia minispora EC-137]|uniref:Uncharacterized protein n=1 Tax=Vararia minispora EC-137 TaxID=1314806 RepID=A0ACB8QNN3_9AGAM|nr:hypothetical protein K488DRAFT_48056 [Vararia minispora EC-137]